jgi:hypothetical protein
MKLFKGSDPDDSSQPDLTKTETEIETELDTTLVETQVNISKLDTTVVDTKTTTPNINKTKTDTITIEDQRSKTDRPWYSHIPIPIGRALLFVVILGSLLQLAKCTFRPDPKILEPETSSQSSTPSTNNVAETSSCATDLSSRMRQANIASKQIDRLFSEKYPDLGNRKLSSQDEALKKEWCQLAEQEIGSRKN